MIYKVYKRQFPFSSARIIEAETERKAKIKYCKGIIGFILLHRSLKIKKVSKMKILSVKEWNRLHREAEHYFTIFVNSNGFPCRRGYVVIKDNTGKFFKTKKEATYFITKNEEIKIVSQNEKITKLKISLCQEEK